MPVSAVIFDLDGVIVDSEIWWHEERMAWAAERGLRWTEADTRAVMGANSRGWARIMRERLALPSTDESAILEAVVGRVVDRYRHGAPVIDGAVEAVRRIAASWPVAVASSADRRVIDAALEASGLLGEIPVIVSSDEVIHGKPEPDVYLEAARRLGVQPAACLVVEDSINGIRAGVAAGMTVVLVPNASVPPASGAGDLAHHLLDRLGDLDPGRIALRPDVLDPGRIALRPDVLDPRVDR
ncbi:MAG TPA: HAD family phosphatase [Candidatus Sulfomarinibacteraceae bacterium]|nr:HAD family phosphatase [Candidatus Sulfomarinibacteraceae bacterium]